MNKIKENGFINDNYILTAIEAECYGRPEIFFIRAKRYDDSTPTILIVDFILAIENDYLQENKYEVCETRTPTLPFDIKSVTEYAKDYLERNALEMYARLKRKLQAGKPSVSFLHSKEYYPEATFEEDKMRISIPRSILGNEVCDIIRTFDGPAEIAFDEEDDAVKIFQSVVYEVERGKLYLVKGIKDGKASVRSFLNLEGQQENSNDCIGDDQKLQDENFEKNAKQILDMFENKSEEAASSLEDDVMYNSFIL